LPDDPRVRSPELEEAHEVAALLYLSSPGGFDFFGGSQRGGLRLHRVRFRREGTDNSREVVKVVELDGRLAGAMAAFPVSEAEQRRDLLIRQRDEAPRSLATGRGSGGWLGRARTPRPSRPTMRSTWTRLATSPDFRRRGVALALLRDAERQARERRLPTLALDTRAENDGARKLYERFGFEIGEERPASPPIPALVGYVKRLA